jgi:hypothetical protein
MQAYTFIVLSVELFDIDRVSTSVVDWFWTVELRWQVASKQNFDQEPAMLLWSRE